MRNVVVLLLAFVWLSCFSVSASLAQSAPAFQPGKTWLFVVGVLKFQDADTTSWDAKNRRDTQLLSLFKSEGVTDDHLVYISDSAATKYNIEQQFKLFLPKVRAGDLLIVYYTGHGGDGSFETYDGDSWQMNWIVSNIDKQCSEAYILLLGDCCSSGSLASAIMKPHQSNQYACISSSSSTEEGHGNWTFSEALLEALRGNPVADTNKDGDISLEEIAGYIKRDIAVYEENHSVFKTTDQRFANMVFAKANASAYFSPQPVSVLYNGKWWTGKLIERKNDLARIRWIQLGYDSPDQDEWIELTKVRALRN